MEDQRKLDKQEFRKVDNVPCANEVISYFTRVPGFNLLYSHVAHHCGVLYSHFTATDEALKEVTKLAMITNSFIRVSFNKEEDRVEYQISFGNTLEYTLRVLQEHFDPTIYQCPSCESFWKQGQLRVDSKCPRCNFQLDKHQDEVLDG